MAAPLAGIKVVDIGWLMVGPVSARYLTDLGADTIKVESGKRVDPLRTLGPFKDGETGPERSLSYHMINAGKRSLAVDLKTTRGLDIVQRLVKGADVFVESFTPGAIDGMGLSYRELAADNPGLIMASTGILGRKGTMGMGMSGTGTTGSGYAGATYLLGWPDRPPTGPYGPWTDAIAPRFLVASVLAALHRRERTGRGTYIDLAQAEAGLQFLSSAYLDFAVNGVVAERTGTLNPPLKSPCGIYACAGEDRWLAIDASSAAPWAALRDALAPALDDARFDTLVGRLRARADLEAIISEWTRDRDAVEAQTVLQSAGVPAHVLCTDQDIAFDTDLEAVDYHRQIEDPVIGEAWIPGPQFTLNRTPHVETKAGPTIGDSVEAILASELGMDAAEVERLRAEGVLA